MNKEEEEVAAREVTARISTLFEGHRELLLGFNQFLPPDLTTTPTSPSTTSSASSPTPAPSSTPPPPSASTTSSTSSPTPASASSASSPTPAPSSTPPPPLASTTSSASSPTPAPSSTPSPPSASSPENYFSSDFSPELLKQTVYFLDRVIINYSKNELRKEYLSGPAILARLSESTFRPVYIAYEAWLKNPKSNLPPSQVPHHDIALFLCIYLGSEGLQTTPPDVSILPLHLFTSYLSFSSLFLSFFSLFSLSFSLSLSFSFFFSSHI